MRVYVFLNLCDTYLQGFAHDIEDNDLAIVTMAWKRSFHFEKWIRFTEG